MADDGKNSLVTKSMTKFKVRMYTDIPPNAVLIGHNIFTKKPKIYSKAFLHMPWFQSKFITMENHNIDLKPKKFQLGDNNGAGGNGANDSDMGLEVVSDLAITYRVKPIAQDSKMGFVDRWQSVINGFKKHTGSSIVKTALLAGATVVGGIIAWPLALAIPALSAGYVSFFHQDEEWVKEQGAYKAAYKSSAFMSELEQTVYEEINAFYATHTYAQIKGMTVDLSKPEFQELKRKLDALSDQYGIETTKVTIKSADLTPESDQILQRKKEAAMQAAEIERQAQAKKAMNDRYLDLVERFSNAGVSPEKIPELVKIAMAQDLGNNAIVNVGGGATPVQPMYTMPINPNQQPPITNDDQDTTGQRTR